MIELLDKLIKEVRTFGFEKVFRRYYSFYEAEVTDNADDEERGRIEVKVPGFFGEKPLPYWAEPKGFIGAGSSKGKFYPPEIGDWVHVEFRNGDPRFPKYSGGWFAKDDNLVILLHSRSLLKVVAGQEEATCVAITGGFLVAIICHLWHDV